MNHKPKGTRVAVFLPSTTVMHIISIEISRWNRTPPAFLLPKRISTAHDSALKETVATAISSAHPIICLYLTSVLSPELRNPIPDEKRVNFAYK